MKTIGQLTRAEVVQSMIFKLFREYIRTPPTSENIRAAKDYYKAMTHPDAPGIALAYYAAFSCGVLKGLELAGLIQTNEAEKEGSRSA